MGNDNKIYYSLPDFYNYFNLNTYILKCQHDRPEYFRSNAVIDSMYGTFPGCIWNSGRTQFGMATYDNIRVTIDELLKLGISVRFTFTNGKLEPKHFTDHYGNTILEIADELSSRYKVNCGVNVSNPDFADYIHSHYPNLYLMWSTTMGIQDVDTVNRLSSDRLLVIPYQMNNTDIIDQFEHPHNIEVLCCETCIDNCPNRQEHYSSLSSAQLIQPSNAFRCPHGCESYYYYDTIPIRRHHISPEMIETHYLPRDINKFKISGRNDNIINVIERYVNYLIKPEYKDNARNKILIDQMLGR